MEVIQRHLTGGFNGYEIAPEGLLVHYVSARYTMPDAPYNVDEIVRILKEHGLGYHDLLPREGGVIELVPAPKRAWHAGKSEWNGRTDCNSWMLGVALIGMHGEPFTDRQYDDLIQRTAQHVQRFPIRAENIAGHEHVAPDRKKDPGPSFRWQRYRDGIAGLWPPDERTFPEFMR